MQQPQMPPSNSGLDEKKIQGNTDFLRRLLRESKTGLSFNETSQLLATIDELEKGWKENKDIKKSNEAEDQ